MTAPVTELSRVAEEVRRAIRGGAGAGSEALVSFADTYAVTPRLKHEALALRLNYRESLSKRNGELSAWDREQDQQQMLELVTRIEGDHSARAGTIEAQARDQALRKLEKLYLDRPPTREPMFVGRGLSKSYARSGFELAGVDLTLRPGEISGVAGQNAHGKTTLLRMVAGELRSDQGVLSYPQLAGGQTLDWVSVKSQIAYLPQELPAWQGSLTENLHFEASLHGILADENRREVAYVIERFDLAEHLQKRWSELSGGYKLRFALARVMVWKPKLLIMDEPLANLDVKAQTLFLRDMRDVANSLRHPMAVLMSSQHLYELEAVSSNVIFLRRGGVVYNGPVAEIGEQRQHNVYEIGTPVGIGRLKAVLQGPGFVGLTDSGLHFVLKTTRDVGAGEVLARMLAAGVAVGYFRDISRAVKGLFE